MLQCKQDYNASKTTMQARLQCKQDYNASKTTMQARRDKSRLYEFCNHFFNPLKRIFIKGAIKIQSLHHLNSNVSET
jgi:hypothetical protein